MFGVDILLKRSGDSWQRNEACAKQGMSANVLR